MSENREMIVATAHAVFTQAVTSGFAPVADAGFASLLVSAENDGFGGDWGDVFAVLRIAGALAPGIGVIAGETMVAAKMESEAGRMVAAGPLTLSAVSGDHRAVGAFVRVALAAGALDAALAMSIAHVNTRQQFGKPLGKFQAVQQNLAIFAVEAAAVNVAGSATAAALDAVERRGGDALFETAAAKLRTNMAIGIGTGVAHQVHGAIGYTQEYPLHHLTSNLIRWRSECGADAYWAGIMGDLACANGGDGLWAELTRRGDG